MISLDQVLLLQKKVETVVQRLGELSLDNERLTSENDALRTKCAELSKALEDKTELVSTLEEEQGKIEEGILSALTRLDTVENSVLGNTLGAEHPDESAGSAEATEQQGGEEPQADAAPAEPDGTGDQAGTDGAQADAPDAGEQAAAEADAPQPADQDAGLFADGQAEQAAVADDATPAQADAPQEQPAQQEFFAEGTPTPPGDGNSAEGGQQAEGNAGEQTADSLNGQFDIY